MRPTIHPIHTPGLPTAPLADHPPVLVRSADGPPSIDARRDAPSLPPRQPMLAPLPC